MTNVSQGTAAPIFDVLGVSLAVGQRVVVSMSSMFNFGPLCVGIIVALSPSITVRIEHGSRDTDSPPSPVTLPVSASRRICVLREDTDAEAWLRRQLTDIEGSRVKRYRIIDVLVHDIGYVQPQVFAFQIATADAEAWVDRNMTDPCWMEFAVLVSNHEAARLAARMTADGLNVQGLTR